MSNKLNLHQKLVEIRKEVSYLQSTNQGFKYKYVSEADILEKLRPKMDELGVLLEFEMPSIVLDSGLLKAKLLFTFIDAENPQDKIEKTIEIFEGGKDLDAKKCGAIMTYGMKYFLFKYFNVGRGDDPDEVQDVPITKEQQQDLLGANEKDPEFLEMFMKQHGIADLRDFPERLFYKAFYVSMKRRKTVMLEAQKKKGMFDEAN